MPARTPLLILLALLVGCDSAGLSERERAELQAGEVQIELGQTEVLDGLMIRFDEVIGDSRCPLDVVCIWQGEAHVALTIDGERVDLLVADPELAPEAGVDVGGLVVFAVALAPYPRADDPSDATPVVAVSAVEAEG